MRINIWRSNISGLIYEMPIDWIPEFSGWTLVGTVEK